MSDEFVNAIVFFAFIFSVISLYLHDKAKYPYDRMTFPGVFPIPFCLFLCSATILTIIYYIKPNFKNMALNKKISPDVPQKECDEKN